VSNVELSASLSKVEGSELEGSEAEGTAPRASVEGWSLSWPPFDRDGQIRTYWFLSRLTALSTVFHQYDDVSGRVPARPVRAVPRAGWPSARGSVKIWSNWAGAYLQVCVFNGLCRLRRP